MKRILLATIAIGILLLLTPLIVLAEEYTAGENATIYTQVFYGNGTPANSANVTLTLWASNGTKIIDTANMTYMSGSQGMYAYNFTCPSEIGTYVADVISASPTGYGSSDIHVSSPITGNFTCTGVNASQIWGENISGYTNTSTFGGLLNSIFGGDNMDKALFLILALVMVVLFIWKRYAFLAYTAAGAWIMLGVTALLDSESASPINVTDTNMALFWLCVGLTITFALLPTVMREKKEPEEIYVEDLDRDLEKTQPRKDRPKTNKPSRFAKTGR